MKNLTKFLGLVMVLSLAIPAYGAMETAGSTELGLTDFQKLGGKPIQAWLRFNDYKYSLRHPAPQATLETSRMRPEFGEPGFILGNTKPSVVFFKSREPARSLVREPALFGDLISSGKPSADWWKARR